MKKNQVIWMTGIVALFVLGLMLFWPLKKPFLQYIGPKWNSTNHTWYAEMCLINPGNKPIFLYRRKSGEDQPHVLYHFRSPCDTVAGVGSSGDQTNPGMIKVDPKQSLQFTTPLELPVLAVNGYTNMDDGSSIINMGAMPTPSRGIFRVGVKYQSNSLWEKITPVKNRIRDALHIKPPSRMRLDDSTCWFEEFRPSNQFTNANP